MHHELIFHHFYFSYQQYWIIFRGDLFYRDHIQNDFKTRKFLSVSHWSNKDYSQAQLEAGYSSPYGK